MPANETLLFLNGPRLAWDRLAERLMEAGACGALLTCRMELPDAGPLVFTRPMAPGAVVCPPDMVFANPAFDFLLTLGGHLAEDDAQYQRLMHLLDALGETHFHLVENQGATVVPEESARPPFAARFSVASTFDQFHEVVTGFDPPFGFYINSFYVFGQQPTWGMYLCELPTLLFIGCVPEWQERFAQVFGIAGNGYAALAPFITQEYQVHPPLQAALVRNYRLS